MSAQADIDDPVEAQLARLAALDLMAVEKVHGRLMAAEDDAAVEGLGRTYQRLARSLRQTLALKARLTGERERAAREAAQNPLPPAKPGGVAIARRIGDVRQAMYRIIWNEHEREPDDFDLEECESYARGVEAKLDKERLHDEFCDEPLDDHVARFCLSLDLPAEGAETWRDLPDPPDEVLDAGDEDSS